MPRLVDVEGGEHPRDSLEVLPDIVGARRLDGRFVVLPLHLTDGHGEAALLLGEEVGPDLVVVEEAQQLAALGDQVLDTTARAADRGPSAGPNGRRSGPFELPTDGGLQLDVVADEAQPEHGGTMEPHVRAAGLLTALTPVFAAIELAAFAVLVERHEAVAQAAAHLAADEVGAPGTALDPPPVGGGELLGRDDGFVSAGEPLAVHLHLTEIDA